MGRKNKILERVLIEKVAAEGKCITKHNDQVVFVEKVAPGDIVDIRVTGKKKNYLIGTPIHFHDFSKQRVAPFCNHFGLCGGCKWQHLPYEAQLEYKTAQVSEQFTYIGKLDIPKVNPIIGAEKTRYYRNKLEFTFSNYRWLNDEEINTKDILDRNGLGFHIPQKFDKIVDIEHCYLQEEPSNAIRLAIKNFAKENNFSFYDIKKHKGLLRNLIIRTTSIGEVMVIVQFGEHDVTSINSLMSFMKDFFPELKSLYYVVNTKKNETFHDLDLVLFHGETHIVEVMNGLQFYIGPKSFYQTNSTQALELYRVVKDFASLGGTELIYDLYTGTGTIALYLASSARKVVGVEYVAEAIEDAKKNAEINSINNAFFVSGDVKDVIQESFIDEHGAPDVVVIDPPRAGLHLDVIKILIKLSSDRIVYVSCNPATQARDLQLLSDRYEILKIQPVDMFPHTHHVENVVLLEKKD